MSFRTLTLTFSSPSLFSSSDPSLLPPPPMPPPTTSTSSSSSPPAASSISSSSSSSSSSASSSLSSVSSFLLSASTSPLTPRTRLAWRAPPPSPRRRPLPHQWMHPTTPTTTSILAPTSPTSSCSNSSTSSTTSSSVDRAVTPTSPSLSPSPYHDPLTSLRLSAFLNDPSSLTTTPSCTTFISSPDRPPRIRQHPTPLLQQRLSLSAPCSPALSSRPSQLVFASGAVGTASALGHVFGRPLQAKEAIPCSPLNCTQWQKEPPQSLAQQAQSPSHTFQQQCAVHKRFRLFRQRPRRCQVHASSYHHGTTSSNGPNYVLPPTTVYPLVVRPDKILLDHYEEPSVQESWWPSLTSSISMSSRLSLSLSTTNTTTSSTTSFQTHGSEDDESSFLSNGGTYYSNSSSSNKAKKLSKKERQLQKQLQKQEQQRQQQQQQRLRCLCYLDTSLDSQPQPQQQQQPQKQHSSQQQQSKVSSWHPQRNSKNKEKEKDKEAAGRLRRIWNESVIFHWSKPPGSGGSGSRQSTSSPSPSPPSSSGYHHHTVNGNESLQDNNGSQVDVGSSSNGELMRHSMSGTDISDEGNHSFSDIEDDLDLDYHLRHLRQGISTNRSASSSTSNNNDSYSHHRVSFQGPYGASSSSAKTSITSRPKDDLKAIARHQAELSLHQQPREDGDDFQYGMEDDDVQLPCMPSMPPPPPPALSNFGSHIIVKDNDEDDEDEDWDIQSDSGAPSSSPMYSADVREPSCRSTLALPMSTPANNKAYLKKPSNANLGSLRSRQRCLSLPADTVAPSKGFLKMSSTPSENWDEDFDIGSADIHVPSKVVENQMSLQMDLYNIKDFASQIEDLKTLRASLRMASSSLKATNPKKHQDLSMLFQRDWEQAEVIIDLGEIAQTSGPTTTSSTSASSPQGPSSLQHSSKKSSEPSLATLSTKPSMGLKPRRPALSTSAPIPHNNNNQLDALSAYQSSQARSESESSNLTGTTLVIGMGSGDGESDGTAASTRTSSRASSSTSASGSGALRVDIESAIEGLAISQTTPSTSPSTRRDSGKSTAGNSGNGMRKASMAFMKESCSSPAGLGLCTSPMTPLRKYNSNDYDDDEDYDNYNDGDLEIKYENGLLRFPEGEQPLKGGYHEKEDSSATVKPLRSAGGSPRSPRESGVFQVDMEASFRRYQKYSHYSKRRTTGGVAIPSGSTSRRLPNQDDYRDDDEDDEEEDDGYESYDYGDGSSIGVFTPIPSDRHMQVLKDILMEGLGTEVARQYMFKQGEQDHVRFSVEVIPGLLGHLKGLQQRLGDQLMELQQLTVIV